MKNFYENPEMEVIAFECEDIITTSGDLSDKVGSDDFNGGAIH